MADGGQPGGAPGTLTEAGTRPWLAFAAMAVPLLALSMDMNGVGMVLPSIRAEWEVGADAIGWVVNATVLTFAALLLPVGRLAPRFGDRRLVLLGIAVFGAASLGCGLAPSYPALLAARVAQGLGGVLAFTTSLAVIDRTFDARRRAAAVGAWGVVNGVGGAVGPVVAGAMTSAWSWRGFFLVNAPLCLGALPALRAWTTPDPADRPHPQVPGLRLAAVGAAVVLLTVGLQATADHGWRAPLPLAALGGAAALAVALLVGGRRGAPPVITAGVRGGRFFHTASIVGFTANWGFGVTIVFMGLYLQDVMGMSAFASGLVFTAFSAACALAGFTIAKLSHRLGLRRAMALGLVAVAIPLAAAMAMTATTGHVAIIVGLALAGFGQGLAFDLSTLAALDGVPEAGAAEASAVLATMRSIGLSVGVAVSTSLVARISGSLTGDLTGGIDYALGLAAVVALVGLAGPAFTDRARRAH